MDYITSVLPTMSVKEFMAKDFPPVPPAPPALAPFALWCGADRDCACEASTIHLLDDGDIMAACPVHDPGGYWFDLGGDGGLWSDWTDWAEHLIGKDDDGATWNRLYAWLQEPVRVKAGADVLPAPLPTPELRLPTTDDPCIFCRVVGHQGNCKVAWQKLAAAGDLTSISGTAICPWCATRMSEHTDDCETVPGSLANRIETGTAWALRAPESVPRIIAGILPHAGIVTMSAHSETGKTWLLMSMLLAVANNRPFLDHYPIEKPGRCLYIGTEGSHAGARNRFHGLARGMGLDPDEALRNIDFLWRDGTLIDDPEFLAQMSRRKVRYAVIGCDIVSDLWSGEENANKEIIALLRGLRLNVTNAGSTIVIVHHWGKDGDSTAGRDEGQRSRGGVAWKTNTDSGIYLTRKKGAGRTTVTCTSSDDVPSPPFSFNWPEIMVDGSEPVTLDWAPDLSGLSTMQLVQRQAETLISAESGLSAKAIAERIGANKATLTIALKGLENLKVIEVRPVTFTDSRGHTGLRRPGYFVTTSLADRQSVFDLKVSQSATNLQVNNSDRLTDFSPIGGKALVSQSDDRAVTD